jgi:RNA-directed DNA polymerase
MLKDYVGMEAKVVARSAQELARDKPVWSERMMAALPSRVDKGWFTLMDKVTSQHALWRGWHRVRDNAGAAGVDRVSVERFGKHAEKRLEQLQKALLEGSYQPQAVRRVEIPKADGSVRGLGIPTVTDRVVQAAIVEVLEPIFEHVFEPRSYGFRPKRGCKDALREVSEYLAQGYVHVVDADLKSYFDTINHERMREELHQQIKDGSVLDLIDRFLRQKVVSESKQWQPEQGTPQGAVLSPLLANVYLHPLDVLMRKRGVVMVRYADDFVVLCRSAEQAQAELEVIRGWVEQAKLTLHPEKTRVANLGKEGDYVDFLGYRFVCRSNGIKREIKPKKLKALRAAIKEKTPRNTGKSMAELVTMLNRFLRGVFEYFKQISLRPRPKWDNAFKMLDGRVRFRLRRLLGKRRKQLKSGRSHEAHKQWSNTFFVKLGLFSMATALEKCHSHR